MTSGDSAEAQKHQHAGGRRRGEKLPLSMQQADGNSSQLRLLASAGPRFYRGVAQYMADFFPITLDLHLDFCPEKKPEYRNGENYRLAKGTTRDGASHVDCRMPGIT